jgi:hypothetical protein
MCACGTDALTGHSLLQRLGHLLSEERMSREEVILLIEQVVNLLLRDDQRVALGNRIDIQKGQEVFIFGHLVAGNIAGYNLRKNTCHCDCNIYYLTNLVTS